MTTDYLEAPKPCEKNPQGDNPGQMLLKDCDMTSFGLLNDKDFAARNTADQHLPALSFNRAEMIANPGDAKFDPSDLTRNVFDPSVSNPRSREHLEQIQNAEKQLPGLIAKSGALADGRTGLSQEDIQKLKQNPNLTREEKAALAFLEKNYDKLKDRDWSGLHVFSNNEITAKSFKSRILDTDPVEGQNPRRQDPRDRQSPDRGQRAEPQPARDFSDTKVVSGGGPWHVAERMLKGQDLDHKSQQDMTKVLQGVWGGNPPAGKELINEQNLEEVRRRVEATGNPKLTEWFTKRYPKA